MVLAGHYREGACNDESIRFAESYEIRVETIEMPRCLAEVTRCGSSAIRRSTIQTNRKWIATAIQSERCRRRVGRYRWAPDAYLERLIADRDEEVRAESFAAIPLRVGRLFGDDPRLRKGATDRDRLLRYSR